MRFFCFVIMTVVMKNLSLNNLHRKLYVTLATTLLLVVAVVLLIVKIQSLYSYVAVLEKQATTQTAQLSTYERTLCSNTAAVSPIAQLSKFNLQSAGYGRSYQVHTPNNYDPSVRYPVIMSFDGIEGSGNRIEAYSGLDALPAIMVYPDSLPGKNGFTSWDGAPYSISGERDVQFVHDLLQALPVQYCVDTTRVFVVGMSNGGSFATIVGCELGSQVKAVATVSGAYYTTCKEEERTPSLLVMHSVDDRQVPFAGSVTRRLPAISAWVEDQAVERNCKTKIPTEVVRTTIYYNWHNCSDGSTLRLVALRNQAHGWLKIPEVSNQRVQGTAGYIWEFFNESSYRD